MGKKLKFVAICVALVAIIAISIILLKDANFSVLQPKGEIGERERTILVFASLLSLLVVAPVFILTFFIVYKYRASNNKATYSPNWEHSKKLEIVWWLVPIALIAILSVVTIKTSHSLDPFKPIQSDKKPITIQVVAMQWKWLFIYPEQNIAVVNLAQFPVDTPIKFKITSDAPMNSFWIPQLGGQIYAMSGMSTQLNLIASSVGDYNGVSANISGSGFSGMHFIAKASSSSDFDNWVNSTKQVSNRLSVANYQELALPSKDVPVTYYSSVDAQLYDTIVMKYMTPMGTENNNEMGH